MTYVEDFSTPAVKAIGAAELLGAVGLILPLATGIAPILTPLAAVGLTVLMIGAVATTCAARRARSRRPCSASGPP